MKNCCVPGCNSISLPSALFLRFPHPMKDKQLRFWKWLEVIGSDLLYQKDPKYVYKYCKLCRRHFSDDQFLLDPRVGILKADAVPNRNLPERPGFPNDEFDINECGVSVEVCSSSVDTKNRGDTNFGNSKEGSSHHTEPSDHSYIPNKHQYKWQVEDTKMLIQAYAIYCCKDRAFFKKCSKTMWQVVADHIKLNLNVDVTPTNCKYRWRALIRSFKMSLANINLPGSRNTIREFHKEIEDIYRKKYIFPNHLITGEDLVGAPVEGRNECETATDLLARLNADEEMLKATEGTPAEINNSIEELCRMSQLEVNANEEESGPCVTLSPAEQIKLNMEIKQAMLKKQKEKVSILRKMRSDRKAYYSKRLDIERSKMQLMLRRNQLLEQRNLILNNHF